jgi:hypothetical protein
MSPAGVAPGKPRWLLPGLLVLLVAFLVSLHAWIEPIRWSDPDALYYQAKTLSFRGEDERAALHGAFRSPIAEQVLEDERQALREDPKRERQFTNPRWIDYTSRFFERRLAVSAMAAAIYPVFHLRSVLAVSLIGYLLLALVLYAFLCRRFGPWTSAAVASICILAPPVRDASFVPMTDSWGLLLETCALLAAVLTFDRSPRWLWGWVGALALLSITRDDTVVPLVAAALLLLHQRDRRSLLLVGSGVAAVLPAILIFGNTSIRGNLAYVFSGFNPPYEETWKFVLHYYPQNFERLLRSDLGYGTHLGWESPLWYLGLAVAVVGVILLVGRLRNGDPYFRLAAYGLLGAALYVALFGAFSDLRQEVVFVPSLAVALALALERGAGLVRERGLAPRPQPEARQGLAGQHLP